MTQDERYIKRCLELASNGLGRTRPNPMVGCVIVKEGRTVSEGYHQMIGENHAERNAILRICPELAEAGKTTQALKGATLYCNLEPCSHYGLTPPCAELITHTGISRVVCCNDDPNPKVDGKGFKMLEAAGIEVVRHVMEADGRWLNRRFFCQQEQHRPYIILKWAESADHYMAPEGNAPYWISNPLAKQLSHKWRTEEAAILIGSQTYLDDHPQLNARLWSGSNPQPVVIDRRGRLTDVPQHWMHLGCCTAEEAVRALHEAKLQSVIVEGGRKILDAFIETGLWDEIRLIRADHELGSGLEAPKVPQHSRSVTENISDNTITYYYR